MMMILNVPNEQKPGTRSSTVYLQIANFAIKQTLMISLLISSCLAPQVSAAAPPEFRHLTYEDFQSWKKALKPVEAAQKQASRDVASHRGRNSDRIDEATAMPDDFKNLKSDMIGGPQWANGVIVNGPQNPGVKTDSDLAQKIDEYEAKYDSLSPITKLAVANLIALKPYRGIIYRLQTLIENQNAPFAHSVVITMLRGVQAGVVTFFPGSQWQAGFDFLAKPYKGIGPSIATEDKLQEFVRDSVLPATMQLAARIQNLNFTRPAYFDNQILYKTANFVSDEERFVLIGEGERLSYLAAITGAVSGIYVSLGYHWIGLIKAMNDVANVYGFHAMVSDPGYMTAKRRFEALSANPQLFTRRSDFASWVPKGYDWLVSSIRIANEAWTYMERDHIPMGTRGTLIDSRIFQAFGRINNSAFNNLHGVIEGQPMASAVVSGQSVQVNLKKLFIDPPGDLKNWFPATFEEGAPKLADAATGLTYRNYRLGNPKAWNKDAFTPYFPGVKTSEDVRLSVRVLNQAWGGAILGVLFAPLML